MTLEEALQELGIDASATPDAARRAYLRGTRTRKPETDPEGFRRLREAYELVASALSAPPEGSIHSLDVEGREEAEDKEKADSPELRELEARMALLPAETHRQERLEMLRKAVSDDSGSPTARWWLVKELMEAGGHDEEMQEALRAGEAAGLPNFLEVRAIYFPASIEAERAARLEASSDPDTLAIAARVHLECSRPREAAAMLHRALDHLVLAAPKPPGPGSIPGWLPRAILGLEAKGEIAAAQALHDRLWSWLQETGDAARLRSWGADGAWTMTHELGLLSSAFPPDLRRSAAQVVLRRKPAADALAEAREFAKRQPKQAEQAAEMLYDLPGLYRLYFRPLQGIAAEPARARSGFLDLAHERFLPGLLLLLFAVLPSLLSLTSDPPAPAMQHAFRQGTLSHDTHEAWRALEGDCDGAPSPLPRAACDAARDAVRKAGEGDCAGARTALTTLDQNLGSVETSELAKPRAFESWLIPALDSACR